MRDEARRNRFYDRFGLFARTLALALSSTNFLENTPEKTVNLYKKDLRFFQNLRAAVSMRFQERVDFSEYEPKIKKLIDTHVGAGDVEQLCHPINLFDAKERQQVLEDQGKSTEAKADMIAAATRHTIEKEMEKDPAFYRKFSKMLEEVLEALHEKRLEALEALDKINNIATKVTTHTDDDIPEPLVGRDMARRFYGCVREDVAKYAAGKPEPATDIAVAIVERIEPYKIRDWRDNDDALNKMRGEIDDVFFEVAEVHGLDIPLETQDKLIDQCVEIAIANED